jgi:hypothetical protein
MRYSRRTRYNFEENIYGKWRSGEKLRAGIRAERVELDSRYYRFCKSFS